MRTVINRMYEDHRILESSPAAATIAAYAVRGCWRTQMYTVTMLSACSFFLLSPLTPVILDSLLPLNDSRQKISTFDTDYSIFGINSDEYYYVTVIHGYITGILIMISIIAGDTFMFIVSEHCGGLFEAVG
uniref:Uncharacterized protein n=1 Tax=Fopius arisanus TaxID=64838 RepID=A0A0C9QI53_9HYME